MNQQFRGAEVILARPARSAGRADLVRTTGLAGVLSLLLTGAAIAAETPPEPGQVAEVVVTASRVTREGYSAPTPTTVVGAPQIAAAAPASLADYINQLPALVGSQTPRVATTSAAATVGANFLNLRALGANRTLVLLDGHRVAPSTLVSVIDTNLLPQSLVQRVDIVTGGASAAWGSDAVAGVVNYVLDKTFTGGKAELQGGESQVGDARYVKGALTYGTSFADGRGHLLFSTEYLNDGGADAVTSRSWFKSEKIIANPAFAPGNGQPARIVAPGVGLGVATDGGLITGPSTITVSGHTIANPLRGVQFDAAGNPEPFNFGFTSGVLSVGGSAQDISQIIHLASPNKTFTAYTRGSFDLTPKINAYVELGYAHADSTIWTRAYERDGNITIRNDNAYLPQTIKDQLTATGQTSFSLGKIFLDWGPSRGRNFREQKRIVTGLQGEFGKGWSWDAYYQYGETNFTTGDYTVNPIVPNFNSAVDAVVNPATGAIVCRSTLTNPTNGCSPLNVFGVGKGSAQAQAYIFGQSVQHTTIKQQVAAASLRGEPFSVWAGPVSIATGVELRKEEYAATTDPLSPTQVFFLGNYRPSKGDFNVKEAFAETVVPFLADKPLAKRVDFNGAVRLTDYSLSGTVTSWKLGLTWDVNDELRFRGTRSRDIRAANLSELFQAGNTLNQTINDPISKTSYSVQQFTVGNPGLRPEDADTTAFGVVYRPAWLPGLAGSIDYFRIDIQGAIFTPSAQQIIDQCNGGAAAYCALIGRNPASGLIATVRQAAFNVSAEATKGVDLDFSYRHDLDDWGHGLKGALTLRALGTYVQTRSVTVNGVKTEYAGTNANADQNSEAVPRWRWLLTQTYDLGPFTTTLTERYIARGVYNRAWGPLDINDNNIPSVTYVDLSASYRFKVLGNETQLFAVVQNLFDKAPPVSPIYGATNFLSTGANGYLYDLIGRQYRAGLRLRF